MLLCGFQNVLSHGSVQATYSSLTCLLNATYSHHSHCITTVTITTITITTITTITTVSSSYCRLLVNTMLILWLSRSFYFYYPALIVLVCAATLFSVGTRLASLLGYQKFLGEDDFSADFIDEGKALMKRGLCTCTLS